MLKTQEGSHGFVLPPIQEKGAPDMEYSFVQLIALGGGTALCLLAVAVLSPMTVARVTEALLDRIEVGLARRASRRRTTRADESIHLSLFDSYRQERAHR
jgi:hypothetical protein